MFEVLREKIRHNRRIYQMGDSQDRGFFLLGFFFLSLLWFVAIVGTSLFIWTFFPKSLAILAVPVIVWMVVYTVHKFFMVDVD